MSLCEPTFYVYREFGAWNAPKESAESMSFFAYGASMGSEMTRGKHISLIYAAE